MSARELAAAMVIVMFVLGLVILAVLGVESLARGC